MPDESTSIQYHLPSLYLDMARAMFCEVSGPHGRDKSGPDVQAKLVPTAFVVAAASVTFSYQALEAFFNRQLFGEWERRGKGGPRAARFAEQFPGAASFDVIRARPLGEKIRVLCRVLDIPTPHERDPRQWDQFKQIAEAARHFVIHPDPEKFQTAMDQIMQKSPIGLYVDVAVALIGHVFTETGSPTPEWLHGPTHFEGRGFTLVGLEPSASSDG